MLGWRLSRIDGHSMAPALPTGSYGVFRRRPVYRQGDTVLVEHPVYGRIVKNIRAIGPDGVWLEGLNSFSVSSEAMGMVPHDKIVGKLQLAIKPPASDRGKKTREANQCSSQ